MHVVDTGLFPLDALGARLVRVEQLREPQTVPVRRPVAAIVAIVIATTFIVVGSTVPRAFAAITAKVQNTASTAGSRTFFTCRNAVTHLNGAGAFVAYAMGSMGTSETDLSGNARTGRYRTTAATSTSIGCSRDIPARSVTFNGTSQCLYMGSATNTSQVNPSTFSIEAWFRTATTSNGRIIGFGNIRDTAADSTYDRHIYLDKEGRIVFGVYPGSIKIVYTAAGTTYANNAWHHVVATLSAAGQKLDVDAQLVMTNAAVTTAEGTTGYWKVSCGNMGGWKHADSSTYNGPSYFTGQIQYAAVYTVALSAAQVREHFQAG